MKKIKPYLLFFGLWSLFFLPIEVRASGEDNQQNSANYSVQKMQPEGALVSNNSSFFDLLVQPGEKRRIQATIFSSDDQPITVNSEIFTTYTNENGQISYTSAAETYDKSLRFKISDFAAVAASDIQAEVAPGESQTVSVDIQVPDNIPDGAYVGSWYFERADQVVEGENSQEGISISNKYSYALGIKLTVNQEIAEPNLNLLDITTGMNNYRKVVHANLQNDLPAVVSQLKVAAEIMPKDEYQVLYKNSLENITMAPNSNYSFPIFFENQPMEAGQYTMELTATTNDPKWSEKTWRWRENFTITENEVQALAAEAINDPPMKEIKFNWPPYLIIGGLLALMLIIWLKYRYERSKRIKLEEKKKSKRKKNVSRKVSHP